MQFGFNFRFWMSALNVAKIILESWYFDYLISGDYLLHESMIIAGLKCQKDVFFCNLHQKYLQ